LVKLLVVVVGEPSFEVCIGIGALRKLSMIELFVHASLATTPYKGGRGYKKNYKVGRGYKKYYNANRDYKTP
jgi:hypothetical protein